MVLGSTSYTLYVPASAILMHLFAHASVHDLTVRPLHTDCEGTEIKVVDLLSHIRYKTPNLQSLCIDLYAPPSEMDEIQSEAALAISGLERLSYLSLPPAWIRDRITKAASELSHLLTLDACVQESEAPFEGISAPLFSTNLSASSFPKLVNLSIYVSYPRAIASFSQAQFTSLEVLQLFAAQPTTREELKQLIIIGSSLPRLTNLRLSSDWASSNFDNVPGGQSIKFQDLAPLSSCKYLTKLYLDHDIVKLLEHLTLLTDLYLNATPRFQAPSSLPISCLSSIVSACPYLCSLGLYMATSSSDILQTVPMTSFKWLETLYVGHSTITKRNSTQVAFFLGHLLPQSCSITGGRFSKDSWDKVRRLAPMFRKAVENGGQRSAVN